MRQRGWKHEAKKVLSKEAFSLGVEAQFLPFIKVDGILVVDLERLWYVLQNLLQSLDQDHRELKKALLALLTVDTTTF